MDPKVFEQYGLAGIVIGVLFFILWRMLIWVMAFVREIKNEHNEERKVWHEMDVMRARALDELVAAIRRHDEKADERGAYIRKEHEKFLENQQVIITAARKTCDCLDDVKEGLGRVNGYRGEHK